MESSRTDDRSAAPISDVASFCRRQTKIEFGIFLAVCRHARSSNAYRSRTIFCQDEKPRNPLGSSRRHCALARRAPRRDARPRRFSAVVCDCATRTILRQHTLLRRLQGIREERSVSPPFLFLGYFKSGFDLFNPLTTFLTCSNMLGYHVGILYLGYNTQV